MLRVRTGCSTCRIRHVKCGEERPQCVRCTSTGRKCDGYTTRSRPREKGCVSIVPAPPAPTASCIFQTPNLLPGVFEDDTEFRYFDYFRTFTVPRTNALLGLDFWSRWTLQMSLVEPAVKHCLLALGCLHRSFEFDQLSDPESETSFAMHHYGKAVQLTSALITRASKDKAIRNRVLMTIILFHCIENFLGHYAAAAAVHLESGLRLVSEHNEEEGPRHTKDSVSEDIISTLHRFELQALTFYGSTMPESSALVGQGDYDRIVMPKSFVNLSEARVALVDLAKWVCNILRQAPDTEPLFSSMAPDRDQEAAVQSKQCQAQLRHWRFLFDALEKDPKHVTNRLLLEMYHTVTTISVVNLPSDPETLWDSCKADFERILSQGESLAMLPSPGCANRPLTSVSLEMGIVMPLFVVATKCRDPVLRRRAIALLMSCRRREGVWGSHGAGHVAQRTMELEEEGLSLVMSATDIPESQRIRHIQTSVHLEKREVLASFFQRSGQDGTWSVRKEYIYF